MTEPPDPAAQDFADGPADALLLVSFGGPERPADVLPFLDNVTRGRGVPRERLAEVARHYHDLGGRSPINDQNRALLAALRDTVDLPVYWGNRNWSPYLTDTLASMRDDGVRRAYAFVTAAYSSWSSCRQYREDVARAQAAVGAGAPQVAKLRHYFNHPAFVACFVDATRAALDTLPAKARGGAHLAFVAHSIPVSMAERSGRSGGGYVAQLTETAGHVVRELGEELPWELVFCSRSGPPSQPWLEPDVVDHVEALHAAGVPGVVLVPIGFVSDHMEVAYDLDTEAAGRAAQLRLPVARAATPGVDPRFVAMVAELLDERRSGGADRDALGWPSHDACPAGCCVAAPRPP